MPDVRPNQIEMIPISRITVLNPRARNKRQHREIVNNIEAIGLKRPITVSRRDGAGGPRYDLVCGEGRLEAFQMLGQTEIPAVVIEASESECLVMSLVENIARRTPRPIDLMREIGALRSRGYNDATIAEKIGVRGILGQHDRLAPRSRRGTAGRRRRNRTHSDHPGDGDFQGRDGRGSEFTTSTPMRPANSEARSSPPSAACSTCVCRANAREDCLPDVWAGRPTVGG